MCGWELVINAQDGHTKIHVITYQPSEEKPEQQYSPEIPTTLCDAMRYSYTACWSIIACSATNCKFVVIKSKKKDYYRMEYKEPHPPTHFLRQSLLMSSKFRCIAKLSVLILSFL